MFKPLKKVSSVGPIIAYSIARRFLTTKPSTVKVDASLIRTTDGWVTSSSHSSYSKFNVTGNIVGLPIKQDSCDHFMYGNSLKIPKMQMAKDLS